MVSASDVFVVADDGVRLAATLYLPPGEPPHDGWAALLEALPYRKDDVTASYRSTYERYAQAGFAVLRLDLRGTGSSGGVAIDEYPDIERRDLAATIRWLASQPWSSGKVGMFGTSYSGFNALQMAAAADEHDLDALGAVVAIYATDDRYTDDVHYCGGVLRALDLIDYPLYMIAMNALPPVPSVWGEGWRDEWQRRVEATEPWLLDWLDHAVDDPTWRRGSIRLGPDGAGYERIRCPTMLIAGWADGYRNNTFRTITELERNQVPWRLIAGPWVHKSPASARPGPNIDDDVEIIAFFDEHLRAGPRSDAAAAQIFVRQPTRPEPDLDEHAGRWVEFDAPPHPDWHTYSSSNGERSLWVRGDVGVAAWNSCGGGLPWGQPLDQRVDNAMSIVDDWPVAGTSEMLGNPIVRLRVRSDQPYGQISVKLCDVWPDGTSNLVTRGMLDLAQVGCWPADSTGTVGTQPSAPLADRWYDLTVELEATTWTWEPGHLVRVAIAGADWPNCWPPPGNLTLSVDAVTLELPVISGLADSTHRFAPGEAHADETSGVEWRVEHDVLARQTRVATRYGDSYPGERGANVTDDYRGELGVSTVDPGQAWANGTASFAIEWPDGSASTEASLDIRSDGAAMVAIVELKARCDDTVIERRTTWRRAIGTAVGAEAGTDARMEP